VRELSWQKKKEHSQTGENEMARVNKTQIRKVASLLKQQETVGQELNFYSFGSGDKEIVCSDMYPPIGHAGTIDFFFFACLHQHGFWYGDDLGYVKPLTGTMNGKTVKGSDLLWKALMKAFVRDNSIFKPEQLAYMEPEELLSKIFADDNGPIPFPTAKNDFKLPELTVAGLPTKKQVPKK